ncbi:MAG: glycosyltransferase [bacterium]
MTLKISVITITYNREKVLARAIKSILAQTYRNYELVVIDDGSTDGTRKMVEDFNSQKIKYVYQRNSGIPTARNLGVKHSTGDYIIWVDSDHEIYSETLEKLVSEVEKDPSLDVVYSDHYLVNDDGEIYRRFSYFNEPTETDLISAAVEWLPVCPCGTLFKRSLYDVVGLYDAKFYKAEDHEFLIRILKGFKYKHVGLPLLRRYTYKDGISHRTRSDMRPKAKVLNLMLERFTFEEMFPKIKHKSQACLEIARIYFDRGAPLDSLKYLIISFFNKPNLGAIKLLVRLGWRASYKLLRYDIRRNR